MLLHVQICTLILLLCHQTVDTFEIEHTIWKFRAKSIPDPNKSTYRENYIDVETQKFNTSFQNLSFCFRFLLKTLFTQCLFHEGSIHIEFRPIERYGFLSINEIYHMFQVPFDIIPKVWYHICVVYNVGGLQNDSKLSIALNNVIILNKYLTTDLSTPIYLQRNYWRIGYCKEANWIISPLNVIFRGKITDFNVWSSPLSTNQVLYFTKDCKDIAKIEGSLPDIISWNSITIANQGRNFEEERMELPSLCKTHKKYITIHFTKGFDFDEAKLRCKQLGGSMPFPKTRTDIDALIELGNITINDCNRYWIPIKQQQSQFEQEEYKWIYEKNETFFELVEYLPWRLGEPNGLDIEQCIVVDLRTGLYSDVMCKPIDQSKYCFFCSFPGMTHFIVRGLPESNEINSHFAFVAEAQKAYIHRSYLVKLEGYLDYDIKWNKGPNYWFIETPTGKKVAELSDYGSSPFGKKEWNISNTRGGNSTILKLSMVSIQYVTYSK